MQQFKGEEFHAALRVLERIWCDLVKPIAAKEDAESNSNGEAPLVHPREREDIEQTLRHVERTVSAMGLRTSAEAVSEFRNFLPAWRIKGWTRLTRSDAATRIEGIQNTIRREMSTHLFMYIPSNRADYYESYQDSLVHSQDINEVRFGKEVIEGFPSAQDDIRMAGNCLAWGANTACVFHLMRIMELGLRALGAALKDPDLDPRKNPTWQRILGRCDAELKKPNNERSPEWKKEDQFFSEATANIRAVKDAWRNPTIHVETNYDEERAITVFRAVRAFMRHLATKLHEEEHDTSNGAEE